MGEISEDLGIMTEGFLHLDEVIRHPLEGGEGGEIVEVGEQGLAADVLVLARLLAHALVPVLELRREGEDSTRKFSKLDVCYLNVHSTSTLRLYVSFDDLSKSQFRLVFNSSECSRDFCQYDPPTHHSTRECRDHRR